MPGVTTDLQRHSNGVPTDARAPKAQQSEPSYYNESFLKPPLWKWEIASYFFLGGMSSGAYLIARMAERFGGRKYRDVTRLGTLLAFASALACPPLLIADLGDPKRFHHMLRVWKPGTPMNLGTWTITGYSGAAAVAVLREWAKKQSARDASIPGKIAELVRASDGALLAITDIAGVPLAILMGSYTGILLSCTANPLWCKNPWLGPMFAASAIGSGAAATSLLLSAAGYDPDSPAHKALEKIDTVAHLAEAAAIAGYLNHAGKNAEPLTRGPYKKHLQLTVGGLVASEVLKYLPTGGAVRRLTSIASAAAGIVSGFSLRWAMVYAGHDAAKNPNLARNISKGQAPKLAQTAAASALPPFAPAGAPPAFDPHTT